jgi:indolepyruvate ferredoxin oxidoreductase
MTKRAVTLDDKYTQAGGRVFMSAIQALVRLPIEQARRDRADGIKTAGFVSGYRGSPLGTYDAALWAAPKLLADHDITFLPGLNEELAASSARGTQELDWLGRSEHQGIFALWYGKGVGTDRAMEALKLGNLEGAAALGGVLVVSGDDHGGKSSASAHQSEHALIAAMIPVLYPANPAEIIEYGLAGWAMSRFSGAYIALKCVTDTLDFSASVALPDPAMRFVHPALAPLPGGLHLAQLRSPLAQEALAVMHRPLAVQAFVRANGLDRTVLDSTQRALSIVAAGKVYLDVRQALDDLGLDTNACSALGIRLYKPALVWPIEPVGITEFIRDSREILVVEEKRPVIEDQVSALLCRDPQQPRARLSGKLDPDGQPLLSAVGELTPETVRRALVRRLDALGLLDETVRRTAAALDSSAVRAVALAATPHVRPPYYCSGCPHNTSTRLPDGSIALSAVGCHGLAAFMPERRTLMPMPMGGDGMPWVAAGPFVDTPHIFQNMGDGTYAHSGILSIRAAVAAGSAMTFKILYNDAVAMTGGQPVEGAPSPVEIVRQLVAERVSPVVIVTDEPEAFAGVNAPPSGVAVHHRDELDLVQRRLREIKGVSGLVYVQTCAAEKRRRRKRGLYPDPDKRVIINPAVCEGCGDCSVQSNCLSIQPLDTEFGRKRIIDQSSCNKDFSCLKGFCPSFVTVEGASLRKSDRLADPALLALINTLPEPAIADASTPYSMLVTGIGGTGVLTVGAVIAMAAHLDGKACTVMDQTGMAQKGGAVTSHVRIAASPDQLHTARLDTGMTDLLVACDMVVAASGNVLRTIKPGVTRALLNTDITPTGAFQTNRDIEVSPDGLASVIEAALGGPAMHLRATDLAKTLAGDSIAANFLMVGYALQKGLLPVSLAALQDAIVLNGANAKGNLATLGLGRLAAHAPAQFATLLPDPDATGIPAAIDDLVESRARLLTDYQNAAYAAAYRRSIADLQQRVAVRGVAGSEAFVHAAANTLGRIMAYKDEYEVARLHTQAAFAATVAAQFGGDVKLRFHLAPPLLTRRDPASGRPRKLSFGEWILPVFRLLKAGRRLRGTWLDPFGWSQERRQERALVESYRELVIDAAGRLTDANLTAAIDLAAAAGDIRGFGPVKLAALEEYARLLPELVRRLEPGDAAKKEAADATLQNA